jgi:alanyl-tRNA synthetase
LRLERFEVYVRGGGPSLTDPWQPPPLTLPPDVARNMKANEIRSRFLQFFEERGHEVRPSSSLIPANDPTLLFTNAGMVQFKDFFTGQERPTRARAVTSQKCVRAGGKHNDLEQVGETTRHHTFFEMLGNFSFGDYFKRDAIRYAWVFLTETLGMDPERLYVTIHYSDDEAFELWQSEAGVPAARIFRLGDRDNFWQMADTGPCGPCSELHYDLRPDGERHPVDAEQFEALGEAGIIMEVWNLVFMQFERDAEGVLHPLPAPSIDTGAGLERLAAVLQKADSNYHTDLFLPLLSRVSEVVGRPYPGGGPDGVSYRVLADHARAVAFLLADGVFPSNEGRGYVLRRILRRAVRHAWLLGRREPSLVHVVEAVIEHFAAAYPELEVRKDSVLQATREEEERFLQTIEGGMGRFDELAPIRDRDEESAKDPSPVIPGDEAFRLYDTFGFPLDLTELMARERGYDVDVAGFDVALEAQRARSRAHRAETASGSTDADRLDQWERIRPEAELSQQWVGWGQSETEARVVATYTSVGEGPVGMILDPNPFYAEAGGQVSDTGTVTGAGWKLEVQEVRRVAGCNAVFGTLGGTLGGDLDRVLARVDGPSRHDTERNHTATHLLHAALREILGAHVAQRGSLVSPERLRFDFSHPRPVTPDDLARVERWVNERIWEAHPVQWEILPREEALARGATALFGEKYGDEVRIVDIPGVSMELCGGTHLGSTAEAGLFRILRESGVASGVRRIEAVTGREAFRALEQGVQALETLAEFLRVPVGQVQRRTEQILEEKASLEALLQDLRRSGGTGEQVLAEATFVAGTEPKSGTFRAIRVSVRDADDARSMGDAFRSGDKSGVLAIIADLPEGKMALFVAVTDDMIPQGVRAGDLVRVMAEATGGRGGGRPHMAQGGLEDGGRVPDALNAALRALGA